MNLKFKRKFKLSKLLEESEFINYSIGAIGILIATLTATMVLITVLGGSDMPIMQRYHRVLNSNIIISTNDGFSNYCLAVLLNLVFIWILFQYSFKAFTSVRKNKK